MIIRHDSKAVIMLNVIMRLRHSAATLFLELLLKDKIKERYYY